MKTLYKRWIAGLFCICSVFFSIIGNPVTSFATTTTDIIVEINIKQMGEDIDIKNKTFYVALFSDSEFTELMGGPKSVTLQQAHSGTITFTGMKTGTYYVAQTNAEGDYLEEDGVSITCSKPNGEVTVKNDDGTDSVTVVMTNDYEYNPNEAAVSSATNAVATTKVNTVTATVSTKVPTTATTRTISSTATVSTVSTASTSSTARTTATTSAKTADENQIGFYSLMAMFCLTAAGWILYDRKTSIK